VFIYEHLHQFLKGGEAPNGGRCLMGNVRACLIEWSPSPKGWPEGPRAELDETRTNVAASCCLLMNIGGKSVIQSQMWPAMIVEPHSLLKRLAGLVLAPEPSV